MAAWLASRTPCPACLRPTAMSMRGILARHGNPPCPRGGRPVGRIWPTRHLGRRVQTIPGPDTWNPTLEGAT